MKVGDYCKHGVVTIPMDADIVQAASTMRSEHVGFLVVIEAGDVKRRPVGVLTDRDITVQVVAAAMDPRAVTVADVMSRKPILALETDDLNEAAQGMRIAGVRRMPVVTSSGALTGVLALDDILQVIAGMACDVYGTVRSERCQEQRLRTG